MPEYTLKLRRYLPESGEAPYWEEFKIDLDGHALRARRDPPGQGPRGRLDRHPLLLPRGDLRLLRRAHQRAPDARLPHPPRQGRREPRRDGTIQVEPMGNMPVIKDLIVDMDAVHWKKMRRVTPWLIPEGDPPEREYIVPAESMIDITQTMACIQCGACVSDCLSMEVDPLFIGPAALAKAYRFVGDPRDGQHEQRLQDLSEDPHGIYDCTHCFNCIEACPKGVAPMSQIMRLRRIATGRPRDQRPQQRLPPRARVRRQHRAERDPPRGRPAARLLRRQVPPARGARARALAALDPEGAADRQGDGRRRRSLHPHKAPKRGAPDLRPRPRQGRALRAQPLRRGRRGRAGDRREHRDVKVAYWPGCVSRGFTPELHGSMAQVAPLLDIELVALDRASLLRRRRDRRAQPGARRHAQRAHVRARPEGDRRAAPS